MKNRFDDFMDMIVTQCAERGEGTGGASRILSGLMFPILTVLVVQLFRDQHYVPLLVLVVLMWTKIAFLVILGTLVYFILTKYWIGVGILAACIVVSVLSASLGKRNIRRLLLSGKPMISPFEGMHDLLLILVSECLFLALALLTHGWTSIVLWSLLVVVVLYHVGRYWFRLRPRWSQIHQPLMVRYAACAGWEAAQAERERREFNFHAAVRSLLKSVYLNREDEDVEEMVRGAEGKMKSFSDRDLLEETIGRTNPSIPQDTVAKVLRDIEDHLHTEEGGKMIVRYAIAEIVESVFGVDERGSYLLAVIEGRAR